MRQTEQKHFFKKILSSRLFLFGISLALIALVVSVGRESYHRFQLAEEINKLETEIQDIEGRNKELASLMEYLKEESYLEKEARLKLNLKKPGEQVVILPDFSEDDLNSLELQENTQIENREILKEKPNYWKWWEYFFAP